MSDPLEDDLRAAFAAAAAEIQPTPPRIPRVQPPAPTHPSRRWWLPLAAAAAVAAIVPLAMGALQSPSPRAAQLQMSGDLASVAGVRFPVPDGWRAAITAQSGSIVSVCVASAPGADCAGVRLDIAVGDASGSFAPVPDPAVGGCEFIELQDGSATIDGRPARRTSIACRPGGDAAENWYLADGSLSVLTAPGEADEQAREIVAGMDLSGWSVPDRH